MISNPGPYIFWKTWDPESVSDLRKIAEQLVLLSQLFGPVARDISKYNMFINQRNSQFIETHNSL
jgi:hypothetical protein